MVISFCSFVVFNIIKKPSSGFSDKVVHEDFQHLLPHFLFGWSSLYQLVDQQMS